MSTNVNSNYTSPPSAGGQLEGLVNGTETPQEQHSQPNVAAQQQQHHHQEQQQQRHQQQQQQFHQQQIMSSQFQQQQQQILQQKHLQQEQQFPGVPTISNMSKFMPPSSAASVSNAAATVAPISASFSASLNGLGARASTLSQASPDSVSPNIPPHLRPPPTTAAECVSTASATATSTASLSTSTMAAPPPLTNGGGGGGGTDLSANSSRTDSPALINSPSHQQLPLGGVSAAKPTLTSFQSNAICSTKFTPTSAFPTSSSSVPSNLPPNTTLTNSMQNLTLNRMNGPTQFMPQQTIPPPSINSNSNPFPTNFQGNFKTGALNPNLPKQQQQPQVPATSLAINRPTQMAPYNQPFNNLASQQQQSPYNQPFNNLASQQQQQQQFSKPPLRPPTTSYPSISQPTNMYGTSAPLMMRPSQTVPPNPAIQNTSMMPPSATHQQNQLNNNQMVQQQQQQQPLPPPPQQQVRKAMYPTTAQLPPMPFQQQQQQQQQQQPYAQAYQQPATFNGQTNVAPLQYQSMQQQQPQQQLQQQMQQQQQYPDAPNYNPQMSVTQQGFNRLWGQDTVDLMQNRHILSPATLPIPKIVLHNQFHESINCNPSIMRCTIAKIPESNALLQKSRLPLGILIHPFRDVNSLPVIQCPNIVRCRLCRTYINPFVYFVDSKMWKCNLCYRVNELPDDFQFDPATKTYGDVTRRPEVRSSTIEFIAPSEYMLRPPQPAIYLFLFDVSIIAQQCNYLENVCSTLVKHLDDMPGDARTQVGFIAYNSHLHFYSMADGYNQPHEMTLLDVDDVFIPRPDNLLVNLKECKELVKDLLLLLPKRFADTHDPGSALGAALQVAYKLTQATGGRVTVFQTCLPNKGPGSLEPREDPNNRSAKDVAHLNPATDFYKRYALECSGYQIAVDLFLLNQQYSDLATISGISKHSGGCAHHFPLYQHTKPQHVDSLKQCFKRYLVRKIGFEAVMRIRCTRGLQVHTFHGNFFVRSTDLLSLPNVNPDAGYGMQISYEESLTDVKTICFQAALLYTNSEGERRIRVHTLCLPVTGSLAEVMHAADTEAIVGLLSKMAVDRSIASNISDAREAFINVTVDILSAFKIAQNLPSGQTGQLVAPRSLALMPLYILALLKHPAFRVGTSTRLDDRVFAMDCMKTLPLDQLMKYVYPEFYKIDALFYITQNSSNNVVEEDDDDVDDLPELPRLQLSSEHLDSRSIFLLDCGNLVIIYVGLNVPVNILENVLGIKATAELPDYFYGLPAVNSSENDLLKRFIMRLNDDKPYPPIVQIIRDTSTAKPQLIEKLVDDRSESSLSYFEFLQHIRTQVK